MNTLTYSVSPHMRSKRTTRGIMIDVCIALLPACIVGCIYFGLNAAIVLAVATLSAVISEIVYRLCCKVSMSQILKEFDFSSVVTGLLVGMNMYANSSLFAVALASVFAIVVVKMLFGGTGKNVVNPAIAGRIFAFMSFGAAFGGTTYYVNEAGKATKYLSQINPSHFMTTGATPLSILYGESTSTLDNLDLLLGTGVGGCIGEVCKLALILGGIYLVIRGVLNFRWPLVYIATAGVTAVIIALVDGMSSHTITNSAQFSLFFEKEFANALEVFLPSILSGGLMLGAIFMATDYVTTPNTKLGNYIYFALLGILTSVLRKAVGGEVVSFVILLMNIVVPLIDNLIIQKPFGYKKPQKEAK